MKEQKYTVVVNSVMELMIAIDLKLNNLKNNSVCLFMISNENKYKQYCDNLKVLNIFTEVIFVNSDDFYDNLHGYYIENKKIYKIKLYDLLCKLIKNKKVYKYFGEKKCEIISKNYLDYIQSDVFIFSEFDLVTRTLYALNKKRKKNYYLGEGTFGYCGNLLRYNDIKNKYELYTELVDDFSFQAFMIKPNYCIDDYKELIEIPLPNRKVIDLWNKVFNYDFSVNYKDKIIFFEESYIGDFNESTNGKDVDFKFVEDLVKEFGNDKIVIKRHPRIKENRFKELNVECIGNYTLPWELFVLNKACKSCVFLSVSSNAVVLPQLWNYLNDEKVYLLFKIFDYKICGNQNNYLNDYMQRYYNLLNNVKQFEIPTSQHELIEKIKGIKK